jgi:structural maintenance of chromosome 1
MSDCIDKVYKDLTKSTTFTGGGVGFLSLEDAEVRAFSDFRSRLLISLQGTLQQWCQVQCDATWKAICGDGAIIGRGEDYGCSGSSIHHSQASQQIAGRYSQADFGSFHPAPFFVLDEVDAALDPTNVAQLARYVRDQAEKNVQFLIISLKSTL